MGLLCVVLREWLDAHLPDLVEAMVAELTAPPPAVSGGRRSC